MFRLHNIIGLAIFIATVIIALLLTGSLAMHADILSFFIIVLPMVSYSLISRPPIPFEKILLIEPLNPQDSAVAASYFQGLGNVSLCLGAWGVVVGTIVIIANLSDLNAIGPGLAVALITLAYSLVAYFVTYSFRKYYEYRSLVQ